MIFVIIVLHSFPRNGNHDYKNGEICLPSTLGTGQRNVTISISHDNNTCNISPHTGHLKF